MVLTSQNRRKGKNNPSIMASLGADEERTQLVGDNSLAGGQFFDFHSLL